MGTAKDDSRLRRLKQDALAIWDERFHADKEMSRRHRFLHFLVLVVKSFNRNRCPIRASALSFTTLLALIPMLAVVLSVTSALLKKQGEDQIYRIVDNLVSTMVPATPLTNAPAGKVNAVTNAAPEPGQTNAEPAEEGTNAQEMAAPNRTTEGQTNREAIAAGASDTNAPAEPGGGQRATTQMEVAREIHQFIRNTRSGTLGAVGAILLVVVGIQMLRSVESTFNDIWGVSRSRNWLSSVQTYCTTLVVGPLLLAGAAALFSGPHLESTRGLIKEIPIFGRLIFPVLTLLVVWLLFTLFYQFVPNTKVRFKAALIGGIVGGTVWHVNNLCGFLYVSRVVSNSRVYGSLGLVPVFMAGVYFSWLVVLFGAQVSYAYQNRALYLQERIAENVNQRGREFVALRLMTCIGQRFQHGLRAQTIQEMSEELCVPSRLVQQVLQTLIAAHLVMEVSGAEPAYTPGRPLEQINAHHILQAMRARGQELLTREEPVREEVYGEFARIQEAEKRAASSITMLGLVNRADARLELAPPPQEKHIEVSPALVPKSGEGEAQGPKTDLESPKPQVQSPKSEPQSPKPNAHGPQSTVHSSQSDAQSPKSEVGIKESTAEQKLEPPLMAATPEPKPVEAVSPPKPVVEPIPDEEREFPL